MTNNKLIHITMSRSFLFFAFFFILHPLLRGFDFNSKKNFTMDTKGSQKVEAVLSVMVKAPKLKAKKWIIITPVPPELSNQSNIETKLFIKNTKSKKIFGRESSSMHRPILTVMTPAKNNKLKNSISFEATYTLILRKRMLIEVKSPQNYSLSKKEKRTFLQSTDVMNWRNKKFKKWLEANKLQKTKGEKDIAFAYRVFIFLVNNGKYDVKTENKDRRPSETCSSLHTDCGGFSLLFTAIMRANDIPARTLWGRWALDQKDDYGQWHVKSEFFSKNIGWVPVEVTGAIVWKGIDDKDCFGKDNGDFITFHIDTDLIVNTRYFGKQKLGWKQGTVFWATGTGTFDGMTESNNWKVSKEAKKKLN